MTKVNCENTKCKHNNHQGGCSKGEITIKENWRRTENLGFQCVTFYED